MAKAKEKTQEVKEQEQKYKGFQLLKLPQYNNRIGRIVLKLDEAYTMAEADKLIKDY